ncbi:DedA family protein [Ruixingdingia sedimenti]|uniref:DedA family protein n=1 Tax=Ruixingdingia sedimenti TaxID=3073604 RepID=A0ABU1FBP4_9RHOB|nr:DedA family protein [Xinfangfangia sp. LG-4]MDR5654284.1 DedA family protein [Xinfangfangia sp. LG-4]
MFEQILRVVGDGGYAGIATAMFAENVFPPIPSEIIMPLAGFHAARGSLSLGLVILAGSAGATLGALFWYFVGRVIGADRIIGLAARHGRWMTVTPEDMQRAIAGFARYGNKAVFWGRLVPGLRSLISVPAGIARMRLAPFLLWTCLGSVIWTTFLALGGFWLETQYARMADWIDPISMIVLAGFGLFYFYRVLTWKAG